MNKKRLFLIEPVNDKTHIPILNPYLGEPKTDNRLFYDGVFSDITNVIDISKDINKSDFILVPHNYFDIKKNYNYIKKVVDLSKKNHKKIILFAYGDSDENIDIDNSIIFRTSVYKSKLKKNEIVMPGYVQDLGQIFGIDFRDKQEIPTVGFCGFADFNNNTQHYKAKIKDLYYSSISLFSKNKIYWKSKKNPILIRKKAINTINECENVNTNIIVRNFFSRNRKTINIDPQKIREEYVYVIKNSDFGLSVKGYGNFSNRFYEILSLGRIPLFIDTDSVLPLEKFIDYEKFIIKIPINDVKNICKYIKDFYNQMDNNKFIEIQKTARQTFENYLKIDKFFMFVFNKIKHL